MTSTAAPRDGLPAPRRARMPAWRYSIGMFGMAIPINMVRGSTLLYYVDIHGLDVRAYGIVMAVYAVIDAVDNPILGFLSDRTNTRHGRRRPWLLVGAPLLTAALVGFFSAPASLEGISLVIWFAFFAILLEASDSMYSANYGALLPEIFPLEHQRAVANSLRQAFQLAALVLSLAVTPVLTTRVFGTETTTIGFTVTAVIYATIALVVLLFMALSARENPTRTLEAQPGFLRTALDIGRTPLFWQIGIATACYLMPMGMALAGIQLYVKYSLGEPVAAALVVQGVVIAAAAMWLFLWTRVVRRRGAPFVWRASFVVLALGFVPFFFAQNLLHASLGGVVLAAGWSGMLATNDLIQARILDEDARVHGVHREGVYLSAFGIFSRLTGTFSGLALGSLGTFFGYYSGQNPGDNPGLAFRFVMGVYTVAVALLGVVISRLIRIPEAGAVDVVDGEGFGQVAPREEARRGPVAEGWVTEE